MRTGAGWLSASPADEAGKASGRRPEVRQRSRGRIDLASRSLPSPGSPAGRRPIDMVAVVDRLQERFEMGGGPGLRRRVVTRTSGKLAPSSPRQQRLIRQLYYSS